MVPADRPWHEQHRSALFFGAVLAIYLASPIKVQSDTGWSVPLALSLVRDGDLVLEEYAETLAATPDYRVVQDAHGRPRSYFPVLAPMAIAPLLGLFTGAVRLLEPILPGPLGVAAGRWLNHVEATGSIHLPFFDTVEHVFASLFAALAVLLFLGAARQAGASRAAWATALVFALGTSLYSSVSRLLWQQVISIPLTCALLWLLVRPPTRGRGAWMGLLLGLLFVARPTNAVVVLAVCAFLALRRRSQLLPCLAGGLLVATAFTLAAQANFGTLVPPYYGAGRVGAGGTFWEAALGHWFSPARGLAIYSPVLLIGVGAFLWRAVKRDVTALEVLAFVVLLLQWVVISGFPHWWGGHGYGPRLFADALPWASWLLLRPMSDALEPAPRWSRVVPLALAAAFSIALHTIGATSRAPHRWNVDPIDVDAAPARLWDWSDPPFLRR